MLGRRHVLPAVLQMVHEIQVEGTFPDGTKLVTVHQPFSTDDGNLKWALYGSFLPHPDPSVFPPPDPVEGPGAVVVDTKQSDTIELNRGRPLLGLLVTNCGDRPIQVGSHYHFSETNEYLRFDRLRSQGLRLNIPGWFFED